VCVCVVAAKTAVQLRL